METSVKLMIITSAVVCLQLLRLCSANPTLPTGEAAEGSHVREARNPGWDCYIILFQDANFGGRNLTVSGADASLADNNFNDIASSAQVFGPCRWMFYTDANFQGDLSFLLEGSYPIWHTWAQANDALTSVRCLPPDDATAIALFGGSDFQGEMHVLFGSRSDLSILNFDDATSSIIITGGTWTLYESANFGGNSNTRAKGYDERNIQPTSISSVKLN